VGLVFSTSMICGSTRTTWLGLGLGLGLGSGSGLGLVGSHLPERVEGRQGAQLCLRRIGVITR